MLTFFTDFYDEEILYSVVCRFHYYMRNKDYKESFRDLFGDKKYIPSIAFSSHISNLANRLDNEHYLKEQLLNRYTLLPLYNLFIDIDRLNHIKEAMYSNDGKAIYTLVGRVASRTESKDKLYYCPVCCREDLSNIGEVYYHRIHQADGVYVCPTHKVILHTTDNNSRIALNRLNYSNINTNVVEVYLNNEYYCLAKDIEYILVNSTNISRDFLLSQYKRILKYKGYIKKNSCLDQKRLESEFIERFSDEFLRRLNLQLNVKYHWLQKTARNPDKTTDPIKHVLLMELLVGDVESFFSFNKDYLPFGNVNWPCLNPVCKSYKKKVIKKCTITQDYKTKLPVGTFKCTCGFKYSRKGPDKQDSDRYKIGSIKEFGWLWEDTLRKYIVDGISGVRALSKLMGCDPKTIVKYASKLNLTEQINTSYRDTIYEDKHTDNQAIVMVYRADINRFISENKNKSRTEVRKALQKQYTYLYRHDKEWLFENLPNKKTNTNKFYSRVDWNARDIEMRRLILNKAQELYDKEPLVRVTKTRLGKELKRSSFIEKKLHLLPQCNLTLKSVCESYEEFRLRRIKYWVDISPSNITTWEIQRVACIKSEYYKELEKYIKQLIKQKRGTYE